MLLAEGPQISGEVLFLILAAMLLIAVASIAVVVLGCIWAYRAGRGSEGSRIGFGIVLAIELLFFAMALTENSNGLSIIVLVAVQAVCFFAGRRRGPFPDPPHPQPRPADSEGDGDRHG